MTHSPLLLLVAILLAGGTAGCFASGITPRTGELLPKGRLGGGVNFTIATFEPGTFEPAKASRTSGNSGKQDAGTVAGMYWLFGLQGFLRYGVSDAQELDLYLGGAGTGVELRQRVVSEQRHDPLSVAAAVAVMWRPFLGTMRPWLRAGFDTSRDSHGTAPLTNLYLTYGPENHTVDEPGLERCGDGGRPCRAWAPTPYFLAETTELRLQMGLGVRFREQGSVVSGPIGPEEILAVAPYVTLWRPQTSVTCTFCPDTVGPATFDARWGGSFLFSIAGVPTHP